MKVPALSNAAICATIDFNNEYKAPDSFSISKATIQQPIPDTLNNLLSSQLQNAHLYPFAPFPRHFSGLGRAISFPHLS
jgi:hypothetical protein